MQNWSCKRSNCDATNSVYPVTMITMRHCSILEFGRGIQSSSHPEHHQTSARHCLKLKSAHSRKCCEENFMCDCLRKRCVVVYQGWISTMTSSNKISWKLPPFPKWKAGCSPGYAPTSSVDKHKKNLVITNSCGGAEKSQQCHKYFL